MELEKDDNQYFFHHVSCEECQSVLPLIQTICRFVVGCLNSRDTGKVGVLVAGVRPESEEKPFVVEGLSFMDPATIVQTLELSLKRAIFSRTGGDQVQFTDEELEMVKIACCEGPSSTGASPNKAHLLLVTVHPQWNVCRDRLYLSSFPDKNGRRGRNEVFLFVSRSLLEERIPSRIHDQQGVLKDKYTELHSET